MNAVAKETSPAFKQVCENLLSASRLGPVTAQTLTTAALLPFDEVNKITGQLHIFDGDMAFSAFSTPTAVFPDLPQVELDFRTADAR